MFLYAKCSLFLSSLRKDHEKAEFEVHEVYAVDVLIASEIHLKQIKITKLLRNLHLRKQIQVC